VTVYICRHCEHDTELC